MSEENSDDPERILIPLVMLPGNMDVLLNNVVPCEGISLVRSEEYADAVVLHFHGLNHEVADELGLKVTRKPRPS